MTGRERVLNTLSFQGADRIPVDLWILPAARMRHGEALDRLLEENETDFASLAGRSTMALPRNIISPAGLPTLGAASGTTFSRA